ncbi:hypothetical protein H6G93_18805 [Nostoc sp. FACHB-973]|uniref:Type IV secretion system coupling protein TraD DNA-binding domain-containing protein n=1 Tax=Desmonostoc muscorum LEGE 12446 TaxID=1828758 RepID=A0A8J7A3W7_DESMC|nr:hypothetical protein [Desmonostoc muscorum]MBD2517030.1 hypothetical protein [Nostoc sp. FACHB-973]MCF2152202.1 hypothetical protein [Desmonostoc muscorum LEGE 12446]
MAKSSNQAKDKLGKVALGNEQISVVKMLTPFEDIIHLAGICELNLGGRQGVGALILKKGENIQIKFCFDCLGIHPNLQSEQMLPIFEGIEAGLKEIPEGESLTIHLGSFTSDYHRQQELSKLESNCHIDQLKLLIRSERLRAKELTQSGVRKNKFLRLWCTYTVIDDDEQSKDFIESIIKKLEKGWFRFTGEIHAQNNTRIENILQNSFSNGFLQWSAILSNKMKLGIRVLSAQEIWEINWQQFNLSSPPAIPNPLKIDSANGLVETQTSDFHIRHQMLENELSVPFFDRKWVKIQNKYVGALNFSQKPGGWYDEQAQLRYLWELISRDSIYDTEVICQLTKANQTISKTNLQRITKQSITNTSLSTGKGNIDVKSGMNIEESLEAQKTIYKGSVVVHTATAFLVHRPTIRELDEACRYLASYFLRPAVVDREIEYAWKTWLQCCPFVWEPLLTKPFNRRLPYFSSEAPGLMPLIRTATGDRTGFELVAEEGGTPVHLDLYQNHKNLAVFGATRSGKSVLVAGILTPALAQDIPVVALDYPKPDGTSTFTDYTNLLGKDGAYFDISKESNNLFELPDLRSLDAELRNERLNDFKEFLKSVLMTMVIGTSMIGVSPTITTNIESIIALALKTFFNDDEIKSRYKSAIHFGFGTQYWSETPTLKDFYNFCSPAFIQLDSIASKSQEISEALNQIRLRINYWLNTRVGQSISRPSSFRTNAKLLVFALRNLSSEADAAILALSAYAAALRRALSSKASIFFLDEAPILFQFDAIADLIGRLCANGAKSGIRVIISAQEPETIYQSKAAQKIFANITTRLVGRIQSSAVDPFIVRFKYPTVIIRVNSTEAFYPKKEGIYSQWLLDDNGKLTFCRYYPAYCLLASVANNPNEQELRSLFLKHYHNNPMLGLVKFSEDYIRMIRGEELSDLAKTLLSNLHLKQVA